jgi:hypothetical protein
VKGDPNLRARLERLASNAGDPPEQGLERVAARRHRRLRRRRGAVVTAAALAVLLGTVSLVLRGGPDRKEVAVSPAGRPTGAAAQLPDTVEVHCTPAGIEIPVASVRPQRDGLHIRVFNDLATPTEVMVDAKGWSGRRTFEPGIGSMRQPVPPGTLTISCAIAGSPDTQTVDLNDVHGYYQEPGVECPADDSEASVTDLQEAIRSDPTLIGATHEILKNSGYPVDELTLGPVRGYVEQRVGDPTDDPVVQVEREGEAVAFVHLGADQSETEGPWKSAWLIEGCRSFLEDRSPSGTTVPPS